jgi:hypothetical protein
MAEDQPKLRKLEIRRFLDYKFNNEAPGGPLNVMFNPSEYALTRTNTYPKLPAPGTSKPVKAFGHGEDDKLSFTLFFDGTGAHGPAGSIAPAVDDFLGLMGYRGEKHAPYYLRLVWGGQKGGLDFHCVLLSATTTYTLFNRDGEPIRAKVSATFEEVMAEADRLAKEKKASPDLHRVWRVQQGESLDHIAFSSYGDPRYWRAIAEANGLENPRALATGTLLRLPPTAES